MDYNNQGLALQMQEKESMERIKKINA
jgi:hypothetical protein